MRELDDMEQMEQVQTFSGLGPVHTRMERDGTERNGTERNGTERNGTGRNGTDRNFLRGVHTTLERFCSFAYTGESPSNKQFFSFASFYFKQGTL